MKYLTLIPILILFIIGCSDKNDKGKFIKVEKETLEHLIIIDSIWANYKISEFKYKNFNFSHKYHYKNDSIPFKYFFILNNETMMVTENLTGEEAYKQGTNLYLLSKENQNDTTEVKVAIACPYTQKSCLQVDILSELSNGKTDTIQSKYNPTSDMILIELTEKNIDELNIISYLCGEKVDKLNIKLEKK